MWRHLIALASLILIILLAASALLPAAASADSCLPSAAAVRHAYGQDAWSTYRSVNGHRCYMLGERHGRSDIHRSVAHYSGPRAGALREVPIVNQLSATEGKRLADEIWSWRDMTLPMALPEAKRKMAEVIAEQKAKVAEAKR